MKPLMPAALLIAVSTVALGETHPDRATHRAGGRGRHEPGFGRVYARKYGFDGGYARARIL